LAQFFTFGHYLRDDTSLEDVRVLPAGGCWTWKAAEVRLERTSYWSLGEQPDDLPSGTAGWLERIDETFVNAVRRCTEGTPHLG
ncbi:hypothetical protein, partial [Salmonella sp. SAL4449]|uniref:hypothetical protein n=1 Tax=Salmonella sp. SAL4449 TaxID=3159904 RepID=UPI003979B163